MKKMLISQNLETIIQKITTDVKTSILTENTPEFIYRQNLDLTENESTLIVEYPQKTIIDYRDLKKIIRNNSNIIKCIIKLSNMYSINSMIHLVFTISPIKSNDNLFTTFYTNSKIKHNVIDNFEQMCTNRKIRGRIKAYTFKQLIDLSGEFLKNSEDEYQTSLKFSEETVNIHFIGINELDFFLLYYLQKKIKCKNIKYSYLKINNQCASDICFEIVQSDKINKKRKAE